MTTDEKYFKAMNILKLIYPEPHYVIEINDTNCYRILDKTINKIIVSGKYCLSGIDFIYHDNEPPEYLINKLPELDVGIIDVGIGGLFLYFYNELENLDI